MFKLRTLQLLVAASLVASMSIKADHERHLSKWRDSATYLKKTKIPYRLESTEENFITPSVELVDFVKKHLNVYSKQQIAVRELEVVSAGWYGWNNGTLVVGCDLADALSYLKDAAENVDLQKDELYQYACHTVECYKFLFRVLGHQKLWPTYAAAVGGSLAGYAFVEAAAKSPYGHYLVTKIKGVKPQDIAQVAAPVALGLVSAVLVDKMHFKACAQRALNSLSDAEFLSLKASFDFLQDFYTRSMIKHLDGYKSFIGYYLGNIPGKRFKEFVVKHKGERPSSLSLYSYWLLHKQKALPEDIDAIRALVHKQSMKRYAFIKNSEALAA